MTKVIFRIPKKLKQKLYILYHLLNKTFLRKYFPIINVTIETTSCCNLKCKGCYRTLNEYPAKNKNMSLEDFKNYINQLPKTFTLVLHGLGEPTLHPDISEIVEYASKSKKFNNILFTTNALAKKPEIYEELFSKGLTSIIISVDSLDPIEVKKLRPFTDIKLLAQNIQYLIRKFPNKINFSMVISRTNFNTFQKTVKKLSELGVKCLSFQPFDAQMSRNSTNCLSLKEKRIFLKKIKNLKIDEMKFKTSEWFKPITSPCNNPLTAPIITVDGYLTPCCRILNKEIFNLGSLKERSFKEIFFSKRYFSIQKNIDNGNYPSFCNGCIGNHIKARGKK